MYLNSLPIIHFAQFRSILHYTIFYSALGKGGSANKIQIQCILYIDMVVEAPAPASYDLSQCLATYHHNALYVSSL